MGLPQDRPQIARESDAGFAKLLRQGQAEPLARAKDTLKGRLLQQITQQALDELQDTEQVVEDAFARVAEADVLQATKEALKARLLQQVVQHVLDDLQDTEQVVQEAVEKLTEDDALAGTRNALKARLLQQVREEVQQEVSDPERLAEAVAEDWPDDETLPAAKESLKARLLQQVREEVLDEVRDPQRLAEKAAEDLASEALYGVKEALRAQLYERLFKEVVEEISDEVDLAPEHVAASLSHEEATVEAHEDAVAAEIDEAGDTSHEAEQQAVAEMANLIDMHFWDEEGETEDETHATISLAAEALRADEEGTPADEAHADEAHAEEAEDEEPGGAFFLSNGPGEAGSDFAISSTGEVDGEAAADAPPDAAADGLPEALPEEDAEPVCYYVYGLRVGDEGRPEEPLPEEGFDAAYPVFSIKHRDLRVFLSKVSRAEFGEDVLEARLHDPDWRERHERIHEALTAQLSLSGAFAPMPFGTIRPDMDQVQALMDDLAPGYLDSVKALEGRRAWTVRLFRDVEVLRQQVVENSETVQALMADIKRKPKGGPQSIKKKMVATINEEVASYSDNCTRESHEALRFLSDDAEVGELQHEEGKKEAAELLLNNTYLVQDQRAQVFKDEVRDLTHQYEKLGFRYEISGPLAPNMFLQHTPLAQRD